MYVKKMAWKNGFYGWIFSPDEGPSDRNQSLHHDLQGFAQLKWCGSSFVGHPIIVHKKHMILIESDVKTQLPILEFQYINIFAHKEV